MKNETRPQWELMMYIQSGAPAFNGRYSCRTRHHVNPMLICSASHSPTRSLLSRVSPPLLPILCSLTPYTPYLYSLLSRPLFLTSPLLPTLPTFTPYPPHPCILSTIPTPTPYCPHPFSLHFPPLVPTLPILTPYTPTHSPTLLLLWAGEG